MRLFRNNLWIGIGPIVLSALSLFISFLILQPIATLVDPQFSLLASRGIGKVAFIVMVIFQILLLLMMQSKEFFKNWLETNVYFLKNLKWLRSFLPIFLVFFLLHALVFSIFYLTGYAVYIPSWGTWSVSLILRILFGFIVVFFLAWTEELIFRGTLFPYFEQTYSTFTSVFLASFIFMLVHDLQHPWNLLTKDISLGIGLFLLGFLLNVVFVITRKLYTGMGVHAGLVFFKVILRRIPCIKFIDVSSWSWWVSSDLRQSSLVHALFFVLILSLCFIYRKKIFKGFSIKFLC